MGAVRLTARSEIRRRGAALLALAVLVGLAGAAVHATVSAAFRARTSYERFANQAPVPNIDVELAEPGTPRQVAELAGLPGVEGVALSSFVAVLPEGQGIPFIDGIAFARIASAGVPVGKDVPVSGRDLDPRRPDEVVLNPAMADELDAGPGDELTLESLAPGTALRMFDGADVHEADGPRVRVRVVGIRRVAEDISDAPDPITVVSPALLQRKDVFGFAGLMGVRADPDRVDEVTAALSERLPGATITPTADLRPRIQLSLDVQAATLLAVGLAAAVAGIGISAQAVVRLVQGSRSDDGVRSVLGMTRGQRAAAAVLGVLPMAVLAAVVAVVGGTLAGPLAVTGIAELAEPDPGPWLDVPVATAVASIVVLLVIAVAAGTPTLRAVRRSGPATAGDPGRWPLVVGLGARRAVGAGASRWSGRSALVAAVLAVATVAGVTTFQRSVDALLVEPDRWAADFDAAAVVGTGRELVADAARELRADERVEAVAEGRRSEVVVQRPGGPIRSAEAVSSRSELGSIRPWHLLEGREPQGPSEAAIGRDVQRRLDVDLGERVRVAIGERHWEVRIVGEVVAYGTDQMEEAILVDPTITDELGDNPDDRYLLVRFGDGVDVDAARRDIGQQLGVELADITPPSTIDRLRQIGALPFALLGFVAALGITAVGHALVASVHRSRRELATLRALGMTRAEVTRIILVQAGTVALLSVLVGVPLGLAIGRQAFRLVERGIGSLGPPVVSAGGAAWAVLGTLLVASSLAALAAARIRPFGWSGALRGE